MSRRKYKSVNRKGFTLIEALVTVALIAVVGGISVAVYMNVIGDSKEKSLETAYNNIKQAADSYSKELNSKIRWYNVIDQDKQYTCVTILDLINAGYFKKDFFKQDLYNDEISNNSYVKIVRNSINKSDLEISVLESQIDTEDKCLAATANDLSSASFDEDINGRHRYTDGIEIKLVGLEDETFSYKCAIRSKNEDAEWKEITASDNQCFADNLEGFPNYKDNYEMKACISDLEDISDYNCGEEEQDGRYISREIGLSDFEKPKISFDPSTSNMNAYRDVKIEYSDENIYDGVGFHYFKSELAGTVSMGDVYLCSDTDLDNIKDSNCSNTKVTAIENDRIYKVTDDVVTFKIATDVSANSRKVHAVIQDKTGNHDSSDSYIPPINTAMPSCDITMLGTAGNNGYYKSNVTVTLDKGEKDGVTATSYGLVAGGSNPQPTNKTTTLTQSADTNGTTYYGYVLYSNETSSTCQKTIKIDKTAPTCSSVTLQKATDSAMSSGLSSYDGSWYKGYATSKPNCTDSGSGCSGSYSVTVDASNSGATAGTFTGITTRGVSGQGTTKHTWTVSDKAGNTIGCSAVNIRLDRTAPSCSVKLEKSKDDNFNSGVSNYDGSWYDGYARSVPSCTDNTNGSGCSGSYSVVVDASKSNATSGTFTGASRGVIGQGTTKHTWTISDKVGNTKTCDAVSIKLDRTAPTCSVKLEKSKDDNFNSGVSNYDGSWYSGYARSKPNCTDNDNGSGCSGSYKVVVDGSKSNADSGTFTGKTSRGVSGQGNTVHTWTISDKTGNSRACSAVHIRLDRTGPACTAKKSDTGDTDGVNVTFSCNDKPDGVSCSGTKACTAKKTKLKSDHTYNIEDNAGNDGKCKVNVTKYTVHRYKQKKTENKTCTSSSCCGTNSTTCSSYCQSGSYPSCPSGCSGGSKYIASTGHCGNSQCYCRKGCTKKTAKTCTKSCCGTKKVCGSSWGSWGGSNTGCGSDSQTRYK